MPSSKNYVRDYKQEAKTSKARGEIDAGHNSPHAKRGRDRREALKLGMIKPSQTLDHEIPLSKGGPSTPSNYRGESLSKNDSYPRNPDGSMKKNVPKKGK